MNHEFLNRSRNTFGWLFMCRCYEDFMMAMENAYSETDTSYESFEDYMKAAHGLFVEFYLRYYGDKYGIKDVNYIATSSNVDFLGKDKNGTPATVLSLYKTDPNADITSNADNLSSFFVASRETYNVPVAVNKNLFVVSNAKSVNKTLLEKAPTIKDKVVFILLDEIDGNVENNLDFWKAFQLALKEEKKTVPAVVIPKFTLRDFQIEAVVVMLKNTIGQVLLPCGTGKSLIQADYTKRYIQEKNPTPVILIVSPRIVLSYQLMKMVFDHLSTNRIDAQYYNLSSGDVEEVSQELFKKMKEQGLVPRNIKATTDIREIKATIDKCKGKIPLVISATYHSAWRLSEIDVEIDVICFDEAHNLVMGRFSEDFKQENLKLNGKNKFFFTATPCNTVSDAGRGMNNSLVFGKEIYRKPYREMIERNEILPIVIQTVNVQDYVLLKDKEGDAIPENMKDADFDRDITSKIEAIDTAFNYHAEQVKTTSVDSNKIAPKIIVTTDSQPVLGSILKSSQIKKFYEEDGIEVFAISTATKYWHNGVVYTGYDFKEKFMKDINALKDTDKAIILHIDMIGEGLDVAGVTSVMAFSTLGLQKLVQLIGRAQRLHVDDRTNLYAGKFFKGMDRSQMMVKPYAYIIVPLFLSDSKDLHEQVREYAKLIHSSMDWVPAMLYDKGAGIGDNEVFSNKDFKGKMDQYDELTFRHEIELDNLLYLQDGYVPDVEL